MLFNFNILLNIKSSINSSDLSTFTLTIAPSQLFKIKRAAISVSRLIGISPDFFASFIQPKTFDSISSKPCDILFAKLSLISPFQGKDYQKGNHLNNSHFPAPL